MASESPGHTLDATALVHEAYMRLIGDQQFDGRGHFFAAAAEAMRRILVNHARDRNRQKRAGGRPPRVDLDTLTGLTAATDDDLLELDSALERLGKDYPAVAELVTLRFLVGMTLGEVADTLGLPRRTADRYWGFAQASSYAARITHRGNLQVSIPPPVTDGGRSPIPRKDLGGSGQNKSDPFSCHFRVGRM